MNIDCPRLVLRIAVSLAVSALLGTGSMVLKTADAVSVLQSQRVDDTQRLSRIESKVDQLLEKSNESSHR
jgi:hypothetical protein